MRYVLKLIMSLIYMLPKNMTGENHNFRQFVNQKSTTLWAPLFHNARKIWKSKTIGSICACSNNNTKHGRVPLPMLRSGDCQIGHCMARILVDWLPTPGRLWSFFLGLLVCLAVAWPNFDEFLWISKRVIVLETRNFLCWSESTMKK